MMSLAFGGGLDGIRGKNAQQWYAYERTKVCMRGKSSGGGNSLKNGLLNVFKIRRRSKPADGNREKILFPKFLKNDVDVSMSTISSMKLTNLRCLK